jgi:hypothetical protein
LAEVLEGAETKSRPAWQNGVIPNWAHLRTKQKKSGAPVALKNRIEVIPLDCVERVRVIAEDPNHSKESAVRGYWCPVEGDCVPFDEVFYHTSPYEKHGELNDQGHPVQHFEDAISVQPWELCPPSRRDLGRQRNALRSYGPATVALPLQHEPTAADEAV